jgi:hypothetical protein
MDTLEPAALHLQQRHQQQAQLGIGGHRLEQRDVLAHDVSQGIEFLITGLPFARDTECRCDPIQPGLPAEQESKAIRNVDGYFEGDDVLGFIASQPGAKYFAIVRDWLSSTVAPTKPGHDDADHHQQQQSEL